MKKPWKDGLRRLGRVAVLPPVLLLVLLYRLRLVDYDTAGEALALVPGALGRWWRAGWYRLTLDGCGEALHVDWMAAIRNPKTRVGNNVYIGVFCWIGLAEIGDDVMLGGHVTVLSGARHHRFDRLDVPLRSQGGEQTLVRIGHDVWVGNRVVVMADVSPGSVVGAGAVVTRTHAPRMILAGVPARPMRARNGSEGGP